MGRTSKKQIDDVQKCTSSICCPFVLLPALGNIRNTVCSYPGLWLHHPKITHEASEQKGNNDTKNGVERNPFIHIATAFHPVPLPFKVR